MRWLPGFGGLLAVCLSLLPAEAGLPRKSKALSRLGNKLCGQIVDYTHNHGADNRIWSAALCQWRDLYVHLPPGYDPNLRYPLGIYLHGANQDELSYLDGPGAAFDHAIASGQMPPVIIVVPDGSLQGKQSVFQSASFFANTLAGNYEDFVQQDVWDFVTDNYPIRPDRESHALVGASMGGSAAFAHAFKHKDRYKIAIGIFPAVNMRWVDGHDHYRRRFDPNNWGWRTRLNPHESMGRTKGFALRFQYLLDPLIGRGPDAIDRLSQFNPIEMLDTYDIQPGDLEMYIAYGGKDELYMDAQVESFLYRARERGLKVDADFHPRGRHNLPSGLRMFPGLVSWAGPRVGNPIPADDSLAPRIISPTSLKIQGRESPK